jgi:hypothetical protein
MRRLIIPNAQWKEAGAIGVDNNKIAGHSPAFLVDNVLVLCYNVHMIF